MLRRLCLSVAGLSSAAYAQQEPTAQQQPSASSSHELAQRLNNPVSNLISVPFQFNTDFSVGPEEGTRTTLNFQPVIPVSLNKDWNVIVRTILPIILQDDVISNSDQFGLGDVTQSFFFSPTRPGPGGFIWAVGPVFLYRTGSEPFLGGGKWGAGPTAIVLKQSGGNTYGMLANHIWSIGGDELRPDISSTFLQPFFSHTTRSATTFGINAESTYDWKGEKWVVPVNLTVTQLTHLGKQPVSVGGGVRYYASAPQDGPNWGVRLIFTLLFPQR